MSVFIVYEYRIGPTDDGKGCTRIAVYWLQLSHSTRQWILEQHFWNITFVNTYVMLKKKWPQGEAFSRSVFLRTFRVNIAPSSGSLCSNVYVCALSLKT